MGDLPLRPWLVAALLVVAAATAHAQSLRYPPKPLDEEAATERKSDLWEAALHPDTKPYQELVRDARHLMESRDAGELAVALQKLDSAVELAPSEPEAYVARGQLFLSQQRWAKCADDLGAAEDHARHGDPGERTRARIDLGVCQARAGRLADAERTLVRTTTTAKQLRSETWMRLGEVRIALGKLDEAIDALSASLEAADGVQVGFVHWLLACAYDRARRPSEASEHAKTARGYDQQFSFVTSPTLPLLGDGEALYLEGLGWEYGVGRPEYAVLYFRHYLATAPDSPWRRRADEHVKELAALHLPQSIESVGSAAVDVSEMRTVLEKALPPLRACLAKLPTTAVQVQITKLGPRTPERRDRPIYRGLPTAGIVAHDFTIDPAVPINAADHSEACVSAAAAKIVLPTPKDKDTYYRLTFYVVGP